MKMLSLPQTSYWKETPFSCRNASFPYLNTTTKYYNTRSPTLSISLSLIWSSLKKQTTNSNAPTLLRASFSDSDSVRKQEEEAEEEYQVLSVIRSMYNDIVIVDTAKARVLLLDSTHSVHSILNKDQKWTGTYWGDGTAAHLMLDLWPSLQLEGWEIDPILIDKARQYFGLADVEKHTTAGGILDVHIGDALAPLENAGIIIDLFCEGKVLAQLQEVIYTVQSNL